MLFSVQTVQIILAMPTNTSQLITRLSQLRWPLQSLSSGLRGALLGIALAPGLCLSAAPEEVDLSLREADSLDEFVVGKGVSKNVYHVEMIVLAHKYDNGISVDENWSYLDDLRFPASLQVIRKNPEAELVSGTPGDEGISLQASTLMTQLNKDQRLLNDMAMQMRLRKGYRLLFHEAWFQQLDSSAKSRPIFIEGGKWYAPYFELSGSVSVSLDRYLHVRTNLWLAEFTTRAERARVPWHSRGHSKLQTNLPTREQALTRALSMDSPPRASQSELSIAGSAQPLYEYEQANVANSGKYLAEKVYLLNERRRVNSTEYHYFDHPRFGLIVKLTPLDQVLSPR